MNKISAIADSESLNFILTLFRGLAPDKSLENLIPFESLPEQYQLSEAVVWDCLLALKCEPQKLDERVYFTTGNLKRLEQFIKRIEISWNCPHILGTCCEGEKKFNLRSSFVVVQR